MNRNDQLLQKLLDAASRAQTDSPELPPFALEAAVLARWRRGREEEDFAPPLWLFRRAAIFAIVVMTLSGAWSYFANGSDADTTALASYAMTRLPP